MPVVQTTQTSETIETQTTETPETTRSAEAVQPTPETPYALTPATSATLIPLSSRQYLKRKQRRPPRLRKPPIDKPLRVPLIAPKVSIINSYAFNIAARQEGSLVCRLLIAEVIEEKENADSLIPEEYREFADVFSKAKADELPPHRVYDYTIPIQESTIPFFRKMYLCSLLELDTLHDYITKNLKTRFIKYSQSPAGALVLFVKKKNGSLRICIDYRGLNKITIKNRYPLLLTSELIDRVSSAKFFTAFDIRDSYNRLRIAPGEEWKIAFRCRYSYFEYNVMPFGLCNALGSF
jgi:hypothetical protein